MAEDKKIKVGLAQFNVCYTWTLPQRHAKLSAAEIQANSLRWLPYSAALLQVYTQKYARQPERYEFLLPLYQRMPVADAVQHLLGADIVGFSTYVWNSRLALEVARRLKAANPHTLIVFGGPHVPDRAEAWLRAYPFVDLACHGEGERVFLQILENSETCNWDEIPGISYLTADGTFVTHPKAARITNMNEIPSPFLEGTFEPLMQSLPGQKWALAWETNRGCPFSCSFCDWGSAITSKVYQFEMGRILREIDWIADHKIGSIFCCDANFGILPRDLDIARAVVAARQRAGFPRIFGVQHTKNATERAYQIQILLNKGMETSGVTISLQSLNATTLQNIKRANISTNSFQELQRRYTRDKIYTYTDIILGLPGETYESFKRGVSQVIENGQHNHVQFYNCSILPNAEMAGPEYRALHGLETVPLRMIDMHTALDDTDNEEMPEYIETVIATATLPRPEWVKAKSFWWMADFLYFDHILQIPLMVLHATCGLAVSDLVEAVFLADAGKYPLLAEIHASFIRKAQAIQQGDPEYMPSPEFLNVWWPADQFALIELVRQGNLQTFYEQAKGALSDFMDAHGIQYDAILLHGAVELNRVLLKVPFQPWDVDLHLSHNVWDFYQSVLAGTAIPLECRPSRYYIQRSARVFRSWDDWCRHLAAAQNRKKSDYLYTVRFIERPDLQQEQQPRREAGALAAAGAA